MGKLPIILLALLGSTGTGVLVHGIYFENTPDPAFPAPNTGSAETDAWVDILRHQNYNNPKNFRYETPFGGVYTRDRREAAMRPADVPWEPLGQ